MPGKLREAVGDIGRIRPEARKANGWTMETYLLRRPELHGRIPPEHDGAALTDWLDAIIAKLGEPWSAPMVPGSQDSG